MKVATLSYEEYRDRVYACWLGKNCGGTLGTPLERAWGEPEPFDVWWYPEIPEGGLPNDDLEMQLVWLKAVEERGFDLTAEDLAQYWLDHIGYNFDEYGLSKTNLRLGLVPPVSGAYNNWFKDCMGSPIRSELWACLAPGVPELAARYAYEDAICDHAGGEGVLGELFNTAIESAAFVVHDRDDLLDLGLSYIPDDSLTARAVRTAREAHRDGLDWRGARQRVLEATPHYVAQYTPINMGFQTIGWLYGEDFGDALCKAVNCGYDTDCTGATLGSILGILSGTAGLPERWVEPLGETIATSEPTGGIRHVSDGSNPIPKTLDGLTDRVCSLGEKLLALREAPVRIAGRTDLGDLSVEDLRPRDGIARLWNANPMEVAYTLRSVPVTLDHVDTPAVRLDEEKPLRVRVENPHPDRISVVAELIPPAGWRVDPSASTRVEIESGESAELDFSLLVRDPASLHNSNRGTLSVQALGTPAQPLIPVVLSGARRWQVCGPFAPDARDAGTPLATPFLPEGRRTVDGGWRTVQCLDNALSEAFGFEETGVYYARLFLHAPEARDVHLGIPANCQARLWLNERLVIESAADGPIRPNFGGENESYAGARLEPGWNEVLVEFVREEGSESFDAHFVFSRPPMYDGITDVGYTRFPWEVDGHDAASER